MSATLVGLVWGSGPDNGAALVVLLALADEANDEGISWPSLEHLAARCRMDVPVVLAIVDGLKQARWIREIVHPLDRAEKAYGLSLDRLFQLEGG